MDPITFKRWVSGIALLTDLQRRSAWQALALSETTTSLGAEAPAASEQTARPAKPLAAQVQPAKPLPPPLAPPLAPPAGVGVRQRGPVLPTSASAG